MSARTPVYLLCLLAFLMVAPRPAFAATAVTSDITSDTHWTLAGSPYVVNFDNTTYFPHLLTVAPGATLTIDPGVVVKFGAFNGIMVDGTLHAAGTEGSPITFTSLQDDTVGGDTNMDDASTTPTDEQWLYLQFNNGSSGTIDHAIVHYGGEHITPVPNTGIENWGGTLTIDHTELTHNGYDGLGQYGGHTTITNSIISDQQVGISMGNGELEVSDTRIHDNATSGIDYQWQGTLSITHSEIANNGMGIKNETANDIDATNNWWGSASGPFQADTNSSGTGPSVSGHVLYSPWLTTDPFAPAPKVGVSNVLFLPGNPASRLYYRGALNIEHQVWEPDYHTDIPYLAMNADGTSKYPLYTKDIIDTIQAHNPLVTTIASLFGRSSLETYSSFEHYMDSLVASTTMGMKEWRAYPYDWRYDVRDIVHDGTATLTPDGSVKQVYLKNVLAEMASTSATGKVTIVAHSNGGLLAKALVIALGADAPKYIDRIVMIGTPQWGTPVAVGALLHGDDQTNLFGIITSSSDVRAVADTMPGTYGLLPTSAYFSHVSDPVATFDSSGALSGRYATSFGASLTSSAALANFVRDSAHLDAQAGSASDLRTPAALSSALVDKATATHAALDAWTPPTGISVVTIAGWGQDTVKALAYTTGSRVLCNSGAAIVSPSLCAETNYLEHTPVLTQDGDGTVVSPSAVGDTSSLYFDSFLFEKNGNNKIIHQNLTAATPVQKVIYDSLTNKSPITEQYIVTDKPTNGTNSITLRISSHSPVNIIVTDANGNQSGVLPIPGTDFSGAKRDIPGSSVQVFDDEEYVNVPQSGSYRVVATGYASGSATLNVDTIGNNGVPISTATFADIPTAPSSTATFSVAGGTSTPPVVDVNGDGKTEFTTLSAPAGTSPLVYVQYMETVVKSLALPKAPTVELNVGLSLIERQLIAVRDIKNPRLLKITSVLRVLIRLELSVLKNSITRQAGPKGISNTSAQVILGMISRLNSLL